MNDYQVKLYTNDKVKPIAVPSWPIQYHLKARTDDVIESMIKEGAIEEHPLNQPASCVFCAEKMPKSDSFLHITLDGCNLDETSISSN